MPFGLPSMASAYQRNMQRILAAQEARYHAVLEEMETDFKEPPEPPEPPEAQDPGGSRRVIPSTHAFSCTNSTSSTEPGDIFQARLAGSAPRAALFLGRMGPSLWHVSLLLMSLSYLAGGTPRVASSPSARAGPSGMYLPAFTQADLPSMLNLPTVITCPIVASHGASSHWHDAGAWVRPCHIDKPERSSSGSRHASRTSPHQALSAFILSRPTNGRLIDVMANHVSSCACSQGSCGKNSKRHHESTFLLCNSLAC